MGYDEMTVGERVWGDMTVGVKEGKMCRGREGGEGGRENAVIRE